MFIDICRWDDDILMRHKIILDCDPGHDDAIALLLAARHPEIELLAVTTVAGNQSVDKTTRNALRICTLAGIDVPIARGMDRPLINDPEYAADIHGESGLDGPDLPEADREPVSQHAVDLLIERLLNSDGEITLVPTGPLTNIAAAIRREPAILPKIKGISLMGGSIGLGNVTPAAEFNIFFDPEAAAIVFRCGRPITVCPLEVTHQAVATTEVRARLKAIGKPVATYVAELFDFFGQTYKEKFGYEAPPVHDPCAVAVVAEADLIRGHQMHVEIELAGKWTRGCMVCDVHNTLKQEVNARVGFDLDAQKFWDRTIDVLGSY